MTQNAPLPKTRLKNVNCIIKPKVISDSRFFHRHTTSQMSLTIILSLPWFYVVIFYDYKWSSSQGPGGNNDLFSSLLFCSVVSAVAGIPGMPISTSCDFHHICGYKLPVRRRRDTRQLRRGAPGDADTLAQLASSLFLAEIRFSPTDRTSCEGFIFSEEIKVGRSRDETRLVSASLLTGDVVIGVQSVLASACA